MRTLVSDDVRAVNLEWVQVVSTNLAAVAWDGEDLWVRFLDGRTYCYLRVPQDVYLGLLRADSKGQYLDRNVKKAGYEYTKAAG